MRAGITADRRMLGRVTGAARGVRRAIFVSLAVLLVLSLFAAWQLRDQVVERRTADAQRATRILEEHANKIIGGSLATLDYIEWLVRDSGWSLVQGDRLLHERLRRTVESRPEVQSVWLFDAAGNVKATSIAFPAPEQNFADRDYFAAAASGQSIHIGRVVVGRITGQTNFNLARRLEDSTGQFLGVLVISLYPAYFQTFYREIGTGADAVKLLRTDGALLARYPQPAGDPTTLVAPPEFIEHLSARAGTFTGRTAFGEAEMVHAYRRLGGHPVYVAYGVSIDRINREWLNLVLGFMPAAIPAFLAIGGFGWLAYRQARLTDHSRSDLEVLNRDLEARVAERTAALTESEERYRSLFEHAPDPVFVADANNRYVDVNTAGCRLLGYDRGEIIGQTSWAFVPPAQAALVRSIIAAGGQPGSQEWELVRKDGLRVPVETMSAPLPGGRRLALVRDVTERKRTRERQELLTAELDHRVKNMLAVVQALARQSLKSAPDVDVFVGRLGALARTHNLLARSDWAGVDLRAVVEGALAAYGNPPNHRFTADGPELWVGAKSAQSLALALHELATNAAKYGALSIAEGRIAVEWALMPASTDRACLTWREHGGPPVVPPSRKGFGSRFLERTVAYELNGRTRVDFLPDGLAVDMEFPVESPRSLLPGPSAAGQGPPAPTPAAAARAAGQGGVLRNRRILLVEDELLVALSLEAAIVEAGGAVVGPMGRRGQALDAARHEEVDAAVLDINVAGEPVWPVAAVLRQRGIPVVFVTGYDDSAVVAEWRHAPRLAKPANEHDLVAVLRRLCGTGRPTAAPTV